MLQDLLNEQKRLFTPGVHTELRGQNNRNRRVVLLSGDVMANVRSDVSGVSARVYRGGVWGFSSMAEYSKEAAATVLKAASENADFMERHAGNGKLPLAPITGLKVSDGMDAHILSPRSYIYVFLTAETPAGAPVELFKAFGGSGTFDVNFTDPAALYDGIDKLYEQLMQKREGVYADAGEKTVILGGMMTGMLSHEAVGHTVEADLVLGGSVAAHNLNKRVASDLVTLTDFAHTAFGEPCPLPVFVDDEGTEAKDVTLIRNGILTGYMNSRESAQHFGMEPGGNARAWMFSDEPLIRMRNTAVHPGKDKLDDMIASIDDGYYLIDSGNGRGYHGRVHVRRDDGI